MRYEFRKVQEFDFEDFLNEANRLGQDGYRMVGFYIVLQSPDRRIQQEIVAFMEKASDGDIG